MLLYSDWDLSKYPSNRVIRSSPPLPPPKKKQKTTKNNNNNKQQQQQKITHLHLLHLLLKTICYLKQEFWTPLEPYMPQ